MQKREEREEDELVTVLACCTTRVLAQNVFNMLLVTYDIFGIRSPQTQVPQPAEVCRRSRQQCVPTTSRIARQKKTGVMVNHQGWNSIYRPKSSKRVGWWDRRV